MICGLPRIVFISHFLSAQVVNDCGLLGGCRTESLKKCSVFSDAIFFFFTEVEVYSGLYTSLLRKHSRTVSRLLSL